MTKPDMTTLVANLRHAARNQVWHQPAAVIGGGHFSGDELKAAADMIESHAQLLEACKQLHQALSKYVSSDRYDPADLEACQSAVAAMQAAEKNSATELESFLKDHLVVTHIGDKKK